MKLAEEFGADAVINAAQDDPVAALKELTRGWASTSRSIAPVPPPRGGAVRCVKTWEPRATSAKAATSRST